MTAFRVRHKPQILSWTKRPLDSGLPMADEFNALVQLLPETDHAAAEVTDDILQAMNERLDRYLGNDGWQRQPASFQR